MFYTSFRVEKTEAVAKRATGNCKFSLSLFCSIFWKLFSRNVGTSETRIILLKTFQYSFFLCTVAFGLWLFGRVTSSSSRNTICWSIIFAAPVLRLPLKVSEMITMYFKSHGGKKQKNLKIPVTSIFRY